MAGFGVLLLSLSFGCGSPPVDADGDDVLAGWDCDDDDPSVGAPARWYYDSDGDGYGVDETSIDGCATPLGYTAEPGDCNDQHDTIHPAAAEICDGLDNDCDGEADVDAADATLWYFDQDGDGFGTDAVSELTCERPTGYSAEPGDCDDLRQDNNPDAVEVCDEVDNNCDGDIDEPGSQGQTEWFLDYDGDGYGRSDADYIEEGCVAPDGYVDNDEDCDDATAAASPDNDEEICDDLLDNDCDGTAGDCDFQKDAELNIAEVKLSGNSSSDAYGFALSGAGDMNRDGYDDFVVGAYSDDTASSNSGTTYVYYGPLNQAGTVLADGQLVGVSSSEQSGSAVAGVGDVDADGFDDLIIGAPSNDSAGSNRGAVYVVRGPVFGQTSLDRSEARYTGEDNNHYAGIAVGAAGDVDADGFMDMLVGAPDADNDAGRAYLISGQDLESGSLTDATARFLAEGVVDRMGERLDGAGDTDGDGFDDVIIGAPGQSVGSDYAGAAYIVRGPIFGTIDLADADASREGGGPDVYAGTEVAGIGDINNDGYADVAVSAPTASSENGEVYILYGPIAQSDDTLNVADVRINGTGAANVGVSVDGGQDFNQDGVLDLVIGGESHADYRGAVFLLPGPLDSGTVSIGNDASRYGGEDPDDYAGHAVSFVGDTNDDGFHDVIVGAHLDDDGGSNAGAIYLLLGGGM